MAGQEKGDLFNTGDCLIEVITLVCLWRDVLDTLCDKVSQWHVVVFSGLTLVTNVYLCVALFYCCFSDIIYNIKP